MVVKAQLALQLGRCFGPRWLAYRLGYSACIRLGLLRRQMPTHKWGEQSLRDALVDHTLADPASYLAYRRHHAPEFLFTGAAQSSYRPLFAQWDTWAGLPHERADLLAQGILHYFSHMPVDIGYPPDWSTNPFTGERAPLQAHWSQIDDFRYGDIKIIWEPSRFGFAYTLVRAYWRTGDERYPELFWQLVEDWRLHNPPQQGANWKCGLETSLRVMAWCFGLYGFLHAQATSAERVTVLTEMIAVSGQRVEHNIAYALSQQNNHSVGEALGLWTIGTLFPELRSASRWRAKGRTLLEQLGRALIYEDGASAESSVNYHRMILHCYVWAIRIAERNHQPFSADLKERVLRAGSFLHAMQDQETGRVPWYGPNDGSLILPLNNCDYQDFRPIIQAIHYLCTSSRRYTSGPWDEDLLWMFGTDALDQPIDTSPRPSPQLSSSGYYTLRGPSSFAFIRCASFKHRPGHADVLHADIWWRGQNIALDPGTYSYNAPAPWDNALASTIYHNTVTVDGLDQMKRASRFLWLPWLRGQVRRYTHSASKSIEYWEGEHDGYQRLEHAVGYRRALTRLGNDVWLVLDSLDGSEDHHYRLHWLFSDFPYGWSAAERSLKLDTPAGAYQIQLGTFAHTGSVALVRADEQSPRGWCAPYYNSRQPALSVDFVVRARSVVYWTLFSPLTAPESRVNVDGNQLLIATEQWSGAISLSIDTQAALVDSIAISGTLKEDIIIGSPR